MLSRSIRKLWADAWSVMPSGSSSWCCRRNCRRRLYPEEAASLTTTFATVDMVCGANGFSPVADDDNRRATAFDRDVMRTTAGGRADEGQLLCCREQQIMRWNEHIRTISGL